MAKHRDLFDPTDPSDLHPEQRLVGRITCDGARSAVTPAPGWILRLRFLVQA
ncbi:MAG: hypothetical protein JSU86_06390 [Phycisphaerales bacterium]|nr:MAG: hypothetical protein JSU86_06390 [Phycisphaerales bacterium]